LSSVDRARPQLKAAQDYCREDDVLCCTKLDRLARSVLQRQREGIAKAKGEGKYIGRQPTARNRMDRIVELFNAGLKPDEIAAKVSAEKNGNGKPQSISVASVYRLRAEARKAGRLGEVRRVVVAA
jgi:DNA invertase Pin-like site-specific DNA recombinase